MNNAQQLSLFKTEEPLNAVDNLIVRQGLRFYSTYCPRIPRQVVASYYSYYKLLYWSGHHLLESIEAGVICRDDIAFRVLYFDKLTRGKILANPDAQYAISFRKVHDAWMHDPIVLVSISPAA